MWLWTGEMLLLRSYITKDSMGQTLQPVKMPDRPARPKIQQAPARSSRLQGIKWKMPENRLILRFMTWGEGPYTQDSTAMRLSPAPALIAIAAMTSLAGCAVAVVGAAGAAGLTAMQDKTLGESVDDTTASNQIRARLLAESFNRFSEVDVEVSRGLVLLTGRVNAPEDRVFAEGIAWTSTLTADVANEIRIEPPGGFLANLSDELISGRVRSRLIGSSSVKSVNFHVETYNGVVYLMGVARTPEELRRAAEEASRVGGVKQVVSYVRLTDDGRRPAAPTTQMPVAPSYQSQPQPSYDIEPLPDLRGTSY
jgi:osmotically-inducible protein OsmY